MERTWSTDGVKSMDNGELFSYFLGDELNASLLDLSSVKMEPGSFMRLDSTPMIDEVPVISHGISPQAISLLPADSMSPAPAESPAPSTPTPKNSGDEDDYNLLPGTKRRRGSSRPLGAPRKTTSPPAPATMTTESVRAKQESKAEAPESNDEEESFDQRQLKNRDAARLFRQRRKEYLRNLEDDARKSRHRRVELENRVRELENANAALRTSLTASTLELDLARLRISEQEDALAANRRELEAAQQAVQVPLVAPESSDAQAINIPPVKRLMESLSVEQAAQVVVCLSIIAGILGPSAGIPVRPAPEQSSVAAISEVAEVTDFVSMEMEDEPVAAEASPVPSPTAETKAELAATPEENQLVQANSIANTSGMLMSNYLHTIDQNILSYFILTAAITQRGIPLASVPVPMRS